MKTSSIAHALICLLAAAAVCASAVSCRKDNPVQGPDGGTVNPGDGVSGGIKGFFLLNQGNMGSNKATLDYYDYKEGTYMRNIFPSRNPDVVKELGDVGNDIKIYGSRLWAVLNASNYLEVMDARTARHISAITVANGRYLAFKDGYAYVTSYAGPIEVGGESRIGTVLKIDTASLAIVGSCEVGYQPEEMAIVGERMYVANSGGYRAPHYDNTISVIDLGSFTEIRKIAVGPNLHRLRADRFGRLYAASRGDYYDVEPKTYIIDTKTDKVTDTLDLPNSNMAFKGDSLYIYSTAFSYSDNGWDISYAIFDTAEGSLKEGSFITDGTDSQIKMPYGLAVHPSTGEIYVTDAGDFVSPGVLYCFSPQGKKKWRCSTGDIPCAIVFTNKTLE